MKSALILFYMIVMFNPILLSHEHHEHEDNKLDTVTVLGKDTIAINGIPLDSVKINEKNKIADHLTAEEELNFFGHLFQHMHNKLVHLPIGLVIAAFLITLLGFKYQGLEPSIKVLVAIAALSTIAVYLTGISQQEAFQNTPKEGIVDIHETLGIITAILIWVWAIFLFIKSFKRFAWIIGAIAIILVLITGLYGGIVAHG